MRRRTQPLHALLEECCRLGFLRDYRREGRYVVLITSELRRRLDLPRARRYAEAVLRAHWESSALSARRSFTHPTPRPAGKHAVR